MQVCKMLEVVLTVTFMRTYMVVSVMQQIVQTQKSKAHKPVSNTKDFGEDMLLVIRGGHLEAIGEQLEGLTRPGLGCLRQLLTLNHMMRRKGVPEERTSSFHHDSIVLRLYVHHVVLSLHGLSLPKLNHLQIFCNSWKEFSLCRTQGLTMSALTRHALFFENV